VGNLFDSVLDWENLQLAFWKARRGKQDRAEVREFAVGLEGRLARMADGLRGATFPVGRSVQFVIRDPKERTITAPCFEERVMHHAVMNVCEPVFDRWLIHDSYACRTGRGREAAILRARHFAAGHPFFLKVDIRKYFESISHRALVGWLERLFKDGRLLDLFERIIGSYETKPGRGLPVGALTSQHFANFYLGWLDRFVKETLRAPGCVRYMDDMLIWGHSSAEMQTYLARCQEFIGDLLELEFKPYPYINRSVHGVDFLGCRVLPDHVILNRRSRVRFQRKMAWLEAQYLIGGIDEWELQQRATSLFAFAQAAGAKSWHFRQSVLQRLPVSGRRPPTA